MKVRNLVEEYPHITNIADPQGMYQLAQDYLRWMEIKNYSDKTIETREFFLFWFIEWCGLRNLIRPSDITKPIIERFQRYMFHYRKANGDQLSFSLKSSVKSIPLASILTPDRKFFFEFMLD